MRARGGGFMPRPTLPTLGPGPESPVRKARPTALSFERPGRASGGRTKAAKSDDDADDRRARGGRAKYDDGGSVLGDGRYQWVNPKTYKRTPTGIVGDLPSGSYKNFRGELYRDLKAPPIQGIAPPDIDRPAAKRDDAFPGPSRGEIDYSVDRKRGGRLSAADRQRLPSSDFALPGRGTGKKGAGPGSYPIPDRSHAANALARSANKSPAVKAAVRAKVAQKFPGMGKH